MKFIIIKTTQDTIIHSLDNLIKFHISDNNNEITIDFNKATYSLKGNEGVYERITAFLSDRDAIFYTFYINPI
jgi:hypothetical protein